MLCDTDLGEIWGKLGHCIAVDRPQLHMILRSGAAAVPCRLSTSVDSVRLDKQRVRVGFSDGSSGEYDLVVGADGTYSTVRAAVQTDFQPDYTGLMIWRSLVPVAPEDTTNFRITFGDGCFFGITPMGGSQTNVFGAVGMPRTLDSAPGRLERFRTRFVDFTGLVKEYLAAIPSDEQVYFGAAESVELDHWHRGRVVLLGDAAHAGAPAMGQGGCMAMEDAYVLAASLRDGVTVEAGLDSYETRRKPRTTWVQQQSRRLVESYLMPPSVRNPNLRKRGSQELHECFEPLLLEP